MALAREQARATGGSELNYTVEIALRASALCAVQFENKHIWRNINGQFKFCTLLGLEASWIITSRGDSVTRIKVI